MSLINDALRRAKQAQGENPAPPVAPVPQLRPVEPPPQATRHGLGLMLPLSLAAIALMSLLLYWEISKRDVALVAQARAPVTEAEKNLTPNTPAENLSANTPAVDPSASSTPPAGSPSPARRTAAEPNASVKESSSIAGSQPASMSSTSNSPVAAADTAETNRPAAVEPPAAAPLKLQSIVYNPRRPSAMINGRILFVGDRVREYRVVTIHADDVLLVGAGQTNVLSLEP